MPITVGGKIDGEEQDELDPVELDAPVGARTPLQNPFRILPFRIDVPNFRSPIEQVPVEAPLQVASKASKGAKNERPKELVRPFLGNGANARASANADGEPLDLDDGSDEDDDDDEDEESESESADDDDNVEELEDLVKQALQMKVVDDILKRKIYDKCHNNVVTLACDRHGSRLLQEGFDILEDDAMLKSLVREFEGHVLAASINMHGNHVLQKAIDLLRPRDSRGILDELLKGPDFTGLDTDVSKARTWYPKVPWDSTQLAKSKYGCRVLERVIEHFLPNDESCVEFLEDVIQNCEDLCLDQYGNFIIQHLLEHGTDQHKHAIVDVVKKELGRFATDQHACRVLDKALNYSSNQYELAQDILNTTITSGKHLLTEMADNTKAAITAVLRVLTILQGDDLNTAKKQLSSVRNSLVGCKQGKEVVEKLWPGEYDDVDTLTNSSQHVGKQITPEQLLTNQWLQAYPYPMAYIHHPMAYPYMPYLHQMAWAQYYQMVNYFQAPQATGSNAVTTVRIARVYKGLGEEEVPVQLVDEPVSSLRERIATRLNVLPSLLLLTQGLTDDIDDRRRVVVGEVGIDDIRVMRLSLKHKAIKKIQAALESFDRFASSRGVLITAGGVEGKPMERGDKVKLWINRSESQYGLQASYSIWEYTYDPVADSVDLGARNATERTHFEQSLQNPLTKFLEE